MTIPAIPATPRHRPASKPTSLRSLRRLPAKRRACPLGRAGHRRRRGRRDRGPLRGRLPPLARRGADRQHRRPPAVADPRGPPPRRLPAAVLRRPPRLDADLRRPARSPCGPCPGSSPWPACRWPGGSGGGSAAAPSPPSFLVLLALSPYRGPVRHRGPHVLDGHAAGPGRRPGPGQPARAAVAGAVRRRRRSSPARCCSPTTTPSTPWPPSASCSSGTPGGARSGRPPAGRWRRWWPGRSCSSPGCRSSCTRRPTPGRRGATPAGACGRSSTRSACSSPGTATPGPSPCSWPSGSSPWPSSGGPSGGAVSRSTSSAGNRAARWRC